jgi:hypothetical protein
VSSLNYRGGKHYVAEAHTKPTGASFLGGRRGIREKVPRAQRFR